MGFFYLLDILIVKGMFNKQRVNEFMEYYSKPMSKDRIVFLNTFNHIENECVELYKDFTISLLTIIGDTYLGKNFIVSDEDRKGHFNWCWNKNLNNFKSEGLVFNEMGEHYYYFYNYFCEVFYSVNDKPNILVMKISSFWENIFANDKVRTNSEYDIFINLYKILKKHFRNNYY